MTTPTITGNICVICPVSSNTITDVDIVCVTPPAMAAAPTTAYPPGLIRRPLIPDWKTKSILSPTRRPKAAPIEYGRSQHWGILKVFLPIKKTGKKTPAGIGRATAIVVKIN